MGGPSVHSVTQQLFRQMAGKQSTLKAKKWLEARQQANAPARQEAPAGPELSDDDLALLESSASEG